MGGGLFCQDSSPRFDHCLFKACHSSNTAGGGYVIGVASNAEFKYCVFSGCDAAQFGGGLYVSGTDPLIQNCTFYNNWAPGGGGGICCIAFASPDIINCIITGTTSGAGLFSSSSPGLSLVHSCFYNNQSANFVGTLPAGTGIINTVNANGDSCDVHHNLLMNPLLVSPSTGNFNLQVASPCIDAGDPATPYDPDGTVADIGAFYYHQSLPPTVDVTMTPVNPPIVIPVTGGVFQYRANMHNLTASAQTFTAWTRWRNPLNVWVNLLGPFSLTLPGNANVTRQRNQNVAGSNPAGPYTMVGYAGPNAATIWDSSYFSFVKSPTGLGGEWVHNNDNWGEAFDATLEAMPSQFALLGNFPNPFNPTTTIRYSLGAASPVNLAVYDLAGREVVRLVDGWREAGSQEATLDGSGWPSGVYLLHLEAEGSSIVAKIMLVK